MFWFDKANKDVLFGVFYFLVWVMLIVEGTKMTDLSKLRIAKTGGFGGLGGESQPTSQDAERLKYLHTYYCATGRLVDTSYDDWIANIDAMKESKT